MTDTNTTPLKRLTIYPDQIEAGDILIDGDDRVMVELNDGEAYKSPGQYRIQISFGMLYLENEFTVEVLR